MTRLGRYELLRVLGKGGVGVVHEAVLHGPDGLRKPVALKVLHEGGEALRGEARLGGLLRHRHLVDVYEVGVQDGRCFCAMELCRLGSLSRRLPLPPRAVVEVGLAVCEALRYAHEELRLVHLDLKPDNLLVDEAGVVKVADLGIARAEGFGTDGRIRGTRGYMAPEQARGERVDARADLYALGVTLCELATGRRPGAAATVDWSTAELDGDEVQPTEGAPEWLEGAVARCLEPDPLASEALGVLRERSMVSRAGEGRLRLLAGVREYAAERLGGDLGPADRHARWFAALGTEEADEALDGVPGARERLALELDNLGVACRHAVARGLGAVASWLLRAAWAAMEVRGPFEAAVRLAESVVGSMALSPSERAACEEVLGSALQAAGRGAAAQAHHELALAVHREAGDRWAEGILLGHLGTLYREQGGVDEARAHYELALAVHREVANRRGEGIVLGHLGILHGEQGRMDEARAHHELALAVHREVGNRRFEGTVLASLGSLHLEQGRLDEARAHYGCDS